MKKVIHVERTEPLILLADEIVYSQYAHWCRASATQLHMSVMRPRQYNTYDPPSHNLPVLLYICGGAFTRLDWNVWMPEMVYFAKRGYAVFGVEYSVHARMEFPTPVQELKEAIRFIRACKDEFDIDPDRIAIMGESAGGYLSTAIGVTGGTDEFDTKPYAEFSSAVQAVIPWYGPVAFEDRPRGDERIKLFDPREYIDENTPPFLILHGLADKVVGPEHSEKLYDALQAKGVEADLYLIEDAEHSSDYFVQPPVKKLMLEFLDKHLKK